MYRIKVKIDDEWMLLDVEFVNHYDAVMFAEQFMLDEPEATEYDIVYISIFEEE